MKVKIIDYFKSISDDAKLIFYLFIFLCVLFIIFFPLTLIWKNDPFKKIILAPLVEEPLKLIFALTFWFAVFQGVTALKIKQWNISDSFLHHFAIYGVITGIAFGLGEGPLDNIFLHAASTLIGAIFILFIFLKVKNKPWKIGYKLTSIVISLSIPMFIHSLSNQFSSIYFSNVNTEFKYLVIIGRYLYDNTIITDSFRFDALMIVIASWILIFWYLYLFFQREKGDVSKKIFSLRIIFAIGIIIGLILTFLRRIDFQSFIASMILSAALVITIWYLYLFFQREQGDVSKKIFSVRVICAIGIIFGLVLTLLQMIDFLSYITSLMILSAALVITIWYLYLFFQREKAEASKKIIGFRIIFAIGIIFGVILTLYGMNLFYIIAYFLHPLGPISSSLKVIVTGLIGPMLFILIPIAGLLLTKKPSEKSDKPKTKWGFRTLFGIGIIYAVYELSTIIQFAIQYASKGFWGDTVQIIYTSVFAFVFPIYFILISIAGLWLTK